MSAQGQLAGKARVWLGLDDDDVKRGLKESERRLRNFGSTIKAVGRDMMSIGGTVLTAFALPVKYASDLEEVTNKFNVVFADSRKIMEEWSNATAKEVGRSKRQIKEFVSSAQDLLVPIGFEPGKAQKFSKQLVRLSLDLASFNNMRDEDTMRDLQAALTGSGEVMKKYGVIVSEAAVKQELFNMSINPKGASEQEKVLARLNIIMRGTTAAQGDVARSSDSVANRIKRLKGNLEDSAAAIGDALLPATADLAKEFSKIAVYVGLFAEQNKILVSTSAKAAAGLLVLGTAAYAVGTAYKVAASAVGIYTAIISSATIRNIAYVAGIKAVAIANYIASTSFVAIGIAAKAALLPVLAIMATAALGYKLGKVLGELGDQWFNLTERIKVAYNWWLKLFDAMDQVRELTQHETNLKLIESWNKQLEEGKINIDEYNKRLKALKGLDVSNIGSKPGLEPNKPASTPQEPDQEAKKIDAETEKLKLQLLYKGYDLKIRELNIERKAAIERANGNQQQIDAINKQYQVRAEILNLERAEARQIAINAAAEQKKAEEAEKLKQSIQVDSNRQKTITDLGLEANLKGFALERARLDLAEQRAKKEAYAAGASLELVEKEFDLRRKILDNQERASQVNKISESITSRGQFGSTAINRAFGSGQTNALEKSNNEIAKNTSDLLKHIKNAGVLAFN